MDPTDFAERMREIYPSNGMYDEEGGHGDADDLMCELLESLGYQEGVAIFRAADKWYA